MDASWTLLSALPKPLDFAEGAWTPRTPEEDLAKGLKIWRRSFGIFRYVDWYAR